MATRTCEVREHAGKVVDGGVAVTDEEDMGTRRGIRGKAAAGACRISKHEEGCHGPRDGGEGDEEPTPFVVRTD
jgi:hypothetical protein